MRKLQITGVTVMAISIISAMFASGAFAAEWLLTGAKITASVAATTEGEVLLGDTGNKMFMTCESTYDGTLGPGAANKVLEVLTLAGVKVKENLEGEGLLCTKDPESICEQSNTDIQAWPKGLPWTEEITLSMMLFRVVSNKASFELNCLVLGISIVDECSDTNAAIEVSNLATDVEAVGEISPLGECSIGGTGTFDISALNSLISSTSGVVSVSE